MDKQVCLFYNVLRPKWQQKLANYTTHIKSANVKSFNQQSVEAPAATIHDTYLSTIAYPPMVTFFSWPKALGLRKVDGILGYEFFKHHPIAINFDKKELKIWHLEIRESLVAEIK